MQIKARRPKQKKSAPYKPRRTEKQVETLMDILSEEEEDTENEEDDSDDEDVIDTTFDDALDWDCEIEE